MTSSLARRADNSFQIIQAKQSWVCIHRRAAAFRWIKFFWIARTAPVPQSLTCGEVLLAIPSTRHL